MRTIKIVIDTESKAVVFETSSNSLTTVIMAVSINTISRMILKRMNVKNFTIAYQSTIVFDDNYKEYDVNISAARSKVLNVNDTLTVREIQSIWNDIRNGEVPNKINVKLTLPD